MGQESQGKRCVQLAIAHMFCSDCIGINVPIIPGIMPIQTYSSFLRLIKLCGTKVPHAISAALEPIRVGDDIYSTRFLKLIMAFGVAR